MIEAFGLPLNSPKGLASPKSKITRVGDAGFPRLWLAGADLSAAGADSVFKA